MATPLPLAMVVCDAVYEDPITRKKTILGTFNSMNSLVFPAVAPQICAYLALTDARAKVVVRIVVVDADEERPPLAEQAYELDFPDPLVVLEVVFAFADIEFPTPGEYRLQLFAGNDFLIERKIQLSSARQRPI